MNIWNGIEALPASRERFVASIGNYDGLHVGHRKIINAVTAEAARTGRRSMLITFDPHPLSVVAPDHAPKLLQNRRQKLDSLAAAGLSDLLLLGFDREMAALSGEEFFARLLTPQIDFASIHVGENFRFGRGRRGDLSMLRQIGEQIGFPVHGVQPVEVDGVTVSSTEIRGAVERGEVEAARRMLGRPFSLSGVVVRGSGRGHELDFPTANLALENELLPRAGVYVTEAVAEASRNPAMTNVGVRPTFSEPDLTVETHLIEFDGDLYGQRIEVRFLARLRDEMRFDSGVELADQIARDRAAAESYFHNMQLRS